MKLKKGDLKQSLTNNKNSSMLGRTKTTIKPAKIEILDTNRPLTRSKAAHITSTVE